MHILNPVFLFFSRFCTILSMRKTIFFLVLLGHHAALSQPGYHTGFLLTASQDSVRGFIKFSSKATVPTPCRFKTNKKGLEKEISAGTVYGFCYPKGAYFVSRSIGRSADVFLEVLLKGRLSLYRFGDMYFVEQGDGTFFELSDGYELVEVEGERLRKKSWNFTRLLSVLMSDCPEATKKATSVKLQEKQLVRLVSMYNSCKGSQSQYFRLKMKK